MRTSRRYKLKCLRLYSYIKYSIILEWVLLDATSDTPYNITGHMAQLENYPQTTSFNAPPCEGVEQFVFNPLALTLVRGIYLAEFYCQDDGNLARFLGESATVEVAFWTEDERDEYELVQEEVERFFEINEGSQRLAISALARHSFPDLRHRNELISEKAMQIWEAWFGFRQRSPPRARLSLLPYLQEDTPVLYSGDPGTSDRYDFMEPFIGADIHAVRMGRTPGSFDLEPHESMVRELIVLGRPTGSRAMDYWFKGCRKLMQRGSFDAHVAELSDIWESRHEGQRFRPEDD